MDINLINEAIVDLESSETNSANVKELACLYILKDKLNKSNRTAPDKSEKELMDIFPAYSRYKEIKTRYQLNEISEDALVPAMKLVAQELEEFILILYNNTYLRKERVCLEQMILNITNKLSNV